MKRRNILNYFFLRLMGMANNVKWRGEHYCCYLMCVEHASAGVTGTFVTPRIDPQATARTTVFVSSSPQLICLKSLVGMLPAVWHAQDHLRRCEMSSVSRSPVWYSNGRYSIIARQVYPTITYTFSLPSHHSRSPVCFSPSFAFSLSLSLSPSTFSLSFSLSLPLSLYVQGGERERAIER